MDILFYIFVAFLAMVSNSFITIILITLRVGISFCKDIVKSNEYNEHERFSALKLRKKYHLSLFIDTLIVCIISLTIILFLKKYMIIYFSILTLFVLISLNKTGKNNPNNVEEFYNSLKANYPYNMNDNIDKGNK